MAYSFVSDDDVHENGHGFKGHDESSGKHLPPRRSPIFNAWSNSRRSSTEGAGSTRDMSLENFWRAFQIMRLCLVDMFILLWRLHPTRATLLVAATIIQGFFPAVRGYSHAAILDEVQRLFATESLAFGRLGKLLLTDGLRMFAETLLEVFASHNEEIVQQSARFHIEFLQMQTRLRLDLPMLMDPQVNIALAEADMFVRSFSGGFMFFSPFDLIRLFTTFVEITSRCFVLWSMSLSSARAFQNSRHWTEVMILAMAIFPTLFPILTSRLARLASSSDPWAHSLQIAEGFRLEERHESMKSMAYSKEMRSEILLFGMQDWILKSWADAKRALAVKPNSVMDSTTTAIHTFAHSTSMSFFSLIQTLPLALQFSSASLGVVTLYRSTAEDLIRTSFGFVSQLQRLYQFIFFLGAFHVMLSLEPALSPPKEEKTEYSKADDGEGMKIDIKDMTFRYPGQDEPALHDVNFRAEPGEVVAIVGRNGSGKSTFLNVLLRLYDFDDGTFLVNDVDVRNYAAEDLHANTSAVFQAPTRLNTTLRENVGIGRADELESEYAIREALKLGGGIEVLEKLPNGIDTALSTMDSRSSLGFGGELDGAWFPGYDEERSALSGGEWQRVAISRAFMRHDADLYVFDEPSSSLDAIAQNDLFERITQGCVRDEDGRRRRKTVIFVTHRMSTVRRADKVALFQNGTVVAFGPHQELLLSNPSYAELYNADNS